MLSLAAKSKARKLAIEAEKRSGKSVAEATALAMANSGTVISDNDKGVLVTALDQDLTRLHDLDAVADKVALKSSELMPKYLPHVNQYLASGANYPNPLLVWCAIWAIDIEDLETAMILADACADQQQLSPPSFKRDLTTYLAESIADWAERQYKEDKSGSPYIDDVCARLSENKWLTDNVIARGKAFKVAGLLAEKNGDDKQALAYFEQAQAENDRAGCKGRVKALKEKLGIEE